MKLLLLVLAGCLIATTCAMFAVMLRRDEPILGLAGLTAALGAAAAALAYSALDEF